MCDREKGRIRNANNPQANIDRVRQWRLKNPEKLAAQAERANKRQPHRESHKLWYSGYKKQRLTHNRNYRARRRENGGEHTEEDIQEILELQGGKCGFCFVRLGELYHVDHVVPLCRGGENGRRNLQILCSHCNLTKAAKDPIAFAQSRGLLL